MSKASSALSPVCQPLFSLPWLLLMGCNSFCLHPSLSSATAAQGQSPDRILLKTQPYLNGGNCGESHLIFRNLTEVGGKVRFPALFWRSRARASHPSLGRGFSPSEMGWYQISCSGLKIQSMLLQGPTASDAVLGKAPPKTKSSLRQKVALWQLSDGILPLAQEHNICYKKFVICCMTHKKGVPHHAMSSSSLNFHFTGSPIRSLPFKQTVNPFHTLHHQNALMRVGS